MCGRLYSTVRQLCGQGGDAVMRTQVIRKCLRESKSDAGLGAIDLPQTDRISVGPLRWIWCQLVRPGQ